MKPDSTVARGGRNSKSGARVGASASRSPRLKASADTRIPRHMSACRRRELGGSHATRRREGAASHGTRANSRCSNARRFPPRNGTGLRTTWRLGIAAQYPIVEVGGTLSPELGDERPARHVDAWLMPADDPNGHAVVVIAAPAAGELEDPLPATVAPVDMDSSTIRPWAPPARRIAPRSTSPRVQVRPVLGLRGAGGGRPPGRLR